MYGSKYGIAPNSDFGIEYDDHTYDRATPSPDTTNLQIMGYDPTTGGMTKDITDQVRDGLQFTYYKKGTDTALAAPPIDAGEYEVVVSINSNDEWYAGNSARIPMKINPKPIQGYGNSCSVEKEYDGSSNAIGFVKNDVTINPGDLFEEDMPHFSITTDKTNIEPFSGPNVQNTMKPIKYYFGDKRPGINNYVPATESVDVPYIIHPKVLTITRATAQSRAYSPYNYYVNIDGVTFDGLVETEFTLGRDYLVSKGKLENNAVGTQTASYTVTLLDNNYSFADGALQASDKTTVAITEATLNAMFKHGGVTNATAVTNGGVLGIQSVIAKAINANVNIQNAIAVTDNEAATSGFEAAVPSVDNLSKATVAVAQSIDNAQNTDNFNYLLFAFAGLIALLSAAGVFVLIRKP